MICVDINGGRFTREFLQHHFTNSLTADSCPVSESTKTLGRAYCRSHHLMTRYYHGNGVGIGVSGVLDHSPVYCYLLP